MQKCSRWLDKITPYIRHIDEEELWYYRYPSVKSFVPKTYLYIIMLGVPALVYVLQYFLSKKDKSTVQDIVNQLYGLSLAYCINGVFTSFLKIIIGRPRPNFFLRCFPDGYGTNIDDCTGEYDGQMDGRKSFPSAHSSFAFTGMMFITLHIFHLLNFNKRFFARGVVFVFALMPLMLATTIAVSRTCDYHHHYSGNFKKLYLFLCIYSMF
ncbi:hypothetical protein NQ314_006264 [Rhamnusium bicolor]|uniref:Phosphatidic acid phosphatase type 2/haloperoxidase domain-containing protein n=1 Tax=Rhamnusium bicolor TaxID=1586634 RepID=A0AAV8Z621_9CUCU|nr:hypothetical protein NQ314_006264 [Rhamnusium bicolor]